jgi:DNA-binding transcriptional MerR regulator
MSETRDVSYLSIGEVLGILLEEFPDVTISKIRFLESQGLIDPERTPSGYRKFYDPDVELLRVILREQRENYLPLRVIKDRLDSGAIDPSGEMAKPGAQTETAVTHHHVGSSRPQPTSGIQPAELPRHEQNGATASPATRAVRGPGADDAPGALADSADHVANGGPSTETVPASSISGHPVSRSARAIATAPVETRAASRGPTNEGGVVAPPQLLPGVVLDRDELCAMVGLTREELSELEQYGIITGRNSGASTLYGDDAVEIASIAVEFLRAGVDARHLRGWRTAAEREASLFEQLITPRLRQRNPEARSEALDSLRRLDSLGARLRKVLVANALRHHFES